MTSSIGLGVAATTDRTKSRAEPSGVLERHAILWLVVLCVPLFFVALAAYDLDSKGEPREGLTAWATIHQDFLLPVLNGERLPEKPLLFPWIVSLSMRVFGETSEWALRLPSALMATGLVLVVHALGRRLVSRRAGLLAATAFASTFLVVSLARRARVDMTLSFFVCAALLLFLAEFQRAAAEPASRRSAWRVAGFWAALALATLTKGPLGAILPWLVIGPYLLLRRRLSFLRTLCPLWGIAILVVGAGSWYAYGLATRGGEFGFRTFLMENILMFMGSEGGGGHQHGLLYFVPNYALFGLPWSLFLPAAAFAALRRTRRGGAAEPLVLPLVWFAAMFLFFSIASGKRSDYLLPLMPAAALLVGAFVADPGEDPVIRRLWTGTAAAVAIVGFAVAALVATAVSPSSAAWMPAPAREYLSRDGASATTSALRESPVALIAILACVALASSATFLWRRGVHGGIPVAAGSIAVAAAIAVPTFVSPLADARSCRPFAEEVRRIVPPGTDVRRYGTYDSQLLFYLHETVPPIGTRSEMQAFVDAPGEAYVVADAESIEALPPEHRDRLERVVASTRDPGDDTLFLLLRRRGAEPPGSSR
jgi:4-amino-4-deoxy-L-arabinose transferase-like glycosyltransferase